MRRRDHLDEVLLVLGELGTINIRRAYGNWAKASLKGWGNLTGAPLDRADAAVRRRQGQERDRHAHDDRRHGPALSRQCRRLRDHVVGQRLPAACAAHPRGGLPVYGFGTAKTPLSFQQACTRFFDVGALALDEAAELEQPATGRASAPWTPNCCKCSVRLTRPPSATKKASRRCRSLASGPRRCRASPHAITVTPACPI